MNKFDILVEQYLKLVEGFLDQLEASSGTIDYSETRSGNIGDRGETYFEFHGPGCYCESKGIMIDFEFPFTYSVVQIIPIDLGFLVDFWEKRKEMFEYESESQIREDYEQAIDGSKYFKHPISLHQIVTPFDRVFNIFQ